jgi:hypothetical protein
MDRGRIRLAGGVWTSGWVAAGLFAALASLAPAAHARDVSNVELWRMIISESIASYARSCPCPYSADRLGQPCGERSAYHRAPSASAPKCFPQDISDEQIARYRERLQ